MTGRIIDFSTGINGKQRVTYELDDDFRELYDRLRDERELDIPAPRKLHRKRSLDANAMLWTICGEIAKAVNSTKEDVYREEIRQVGEYTPLPIKAEAVETFSDIWAAKGTGWFIEVVDDSKLPGYKLIFAYNGSSTYDTKQMSRLIDNAIQDARALGIDVMSDEEKSLLLDDWRQRKKD